MKNIVCIIFVYMLLGCSTYPILPDKAVQVPEERIFKKELTQKSDQKSEVVFLRDAGIYSSANYVQLFLNKELFAEIDRGEILSIWLAPGVYSFSAKPTFVLNINRVMEIELEVKPGRRHSFRIGFGLDGMIFYPTSY